MTGSTARLSLNQITTKRWSLAEAVNGCADAGLTAIGLWRDKVAEVGTATAAKLVADAGLSVSSLCRGGFFPAADKVDRRERLDDNRRAVEEAAALGTDVLILVCGGVVDRNLDRSRGMVADGIETLAPHAQTHGVKLAIEPLHPAFCGDRSVVVTLDQALDLAEPYPADVVGVAVDTYHVWWDPGVVTAIQRAAGRIHSFQLGDWLVPAADVLMGRGMLGDGVIDLRALIAAVDKAGYDGPIEVELFNAEIWDTEGAVVVEQIKADYARLVHDGTER